MREEKERGKVDRYVGAEWWRKYVIYSLLPTHSYSEIGEGLIHEGCGAAGKGKGELDRRG